MRDTKRDQVVVIGVIAEILSDLQQDFVGKADDRGSGLRVVGDWSSILAELVGTCASHCTHSI